MSSSCNVVSKDNICFNCIRFRGTNKRAKPKPKCKVNGALDSCEEFEHRFKQKGGWRLNNEL